MSPQIIFKEESYKIVGACYEVYREKGCGFVEPVYQECMELELRLQQIPNIPQKPLRLEYKGQQLASSYIADFICYDKIIVELKVVSDLNDEHRAQVQNYLKATQLHLGLLVNFGHYPKVQIERIAGGLGRYSARQRPTQTETLKDNPTGQMQTRLTNHEIRQIHENNL
jgi:GxxExxY protein